MQPFATKVNTSSGLKIESENAEFFSLGKAEGSANTLCIGGFFQRSMAEKRQVLYLIFEQGLVLFNNGQVRAHIDNLGSGLMKTAIEIINVFTSRDEKELEAAFNEKLAKLINNSLNTDAKRLM